MAFLLTSCAASCALQALASACCSIAGCLLPRSAKVAKILYVSIFAASAVLGIVLRYYGEQALSSWVAVMKVCDTGACWGLQADFRISSAVLAFFLIMTLVTVVLPCLHHGAWLLKLLLYVALLGISLAISNDFYETYGQIARYGSIVFLVIQVVVFIDLAYTLHEWLLHKIEARDKAMDEAGWQPGVFSNCWKMLYLLVSGACVVASIASLGVMFKYFGQCSLMQFFIAQTLIVGVAFIIVGFFPAVQSGLLPPAVIFAYNTYLVYGALSNNPEASCNIMARSDNQNQASIIAGLAFAVISVTYAAYSSASSIAKALSMPVTPAASPASAGTADSLELGAVAGSGTAATTAGAAKDGATASASSSAASPTAYAAAATAPSADASSGCCGPAHAAAAGADVVEARPWLFHLSMCFAGLYLAMLMTNWGDPAASTATGPSNGNPELSLASMWVRIVSQWLVYAVFGWTLLAPMCFPNRDFSTPARR